jgi:hypothetical protein
VQTETGKDITLSAPLAGAYRVSLEVEFEAQDNSPRTLSQTKDIVVGSAAVTTQAQVQKFLASMASVVGAKSKKVYEFALLGAAVLVGVLGSLGLIKAKSRK